MIRTTKDGTEYKLISDGLYRWTRQGSVAEGLKGAFIRKVDALRAFDVYEATRVPWVILPADMATNGN